MYVLQNYYQFCFEHTHHHTPHHPPLLSSSFSTKEEQTHQFFHSLMKQTEIPVHYHNKKKKLDIDQYIVKASCFKDAKESYIENICINI